MKQLPVEVVALVREYLSPTFNSMLSLSCKSLFDEEREHKVEVADVTASISLLRYVYRGVPKKPATFAYAARNGDIAVLQWLKENGAPWDERACLYAAENGHLHALRWMWENEAPWNDWKVCSLAAREGHLHVLQWLKEIGAPWKEVACPSAAEGGGICMRSAG